MVGLGRVVPEVLDAVQDLADAEEPSPGARQLQAGVGPQLARGAKDLRVVFWPNIIALFHGKEVPYDVWWKKMRDSNPKISALCTEREVPNPERAGFTAAPKLPGGARTLAESISRRA